MGAITDTLGIGPGPRQGGNWQAGSTDIVSPVTQAQADTAYNQSQTGIQQQQDFLTALQAQNGVSNQSAVYNQLAGIANGTGPNPAQAMLNQATGANIANQAAVAAGQRGTSANVGQIARQVGQQGANIQQQAVGQGATMQANQALNAIGAMGNISGQQVANQAAATTGYNQAVQSEQQNLLNSINQANQSRVGLQNGVNAANAGIASTNATGQQKFIGGVESGALAALSQGGEVKKPIKMAAGGATPNLGVNTTLPFSGPQSSFAKMLYGSAPTNTPGNQSQGNNSANTATSVDPLQQGGYNVGKGATTGIKSLFSSSGGGGSSAGSTGAEVAGGGAPMEAAVMNKGGKVKALLSPGEIYLPPQKVKELAKSPNKGEKALKEGERIPGKAKVKGDSLKNDTVRKNLDAGGIVVKRTAAKSPDKAEAFINAILAKHRR